MSSILRSGNTLGGRRRVPLLPMPELPFNNPLNVFVRLLQHRSSQHVGSETLDFRETGAAQALSQAAWGEAERPSSLPLEPSEPFFNLALRGIRQLQANLETAPHGAIEQFRVVAGGHHYDVAGKGVNLEQEGTDHSFDFAGLVDIAASFPMASNSSKNNTHWRDLAYSNTWLMRWAVSPR